MCVFVRGRERERERETEQERDAPPLTVTVVTGVTTRLIILSESIRDIRRGVDMSCGVMSLRLHCLLGTLPYFTYLHIPSWSLSQLGCDPLATCPA